MQQVADGLLPAYKREPEIRSLEDIRFLDEEADALPDRVFLRTEYLLVKKDISPHLI
jgi:hypothetical protein